MSTRRAGPNGRSELRIPPVDVDELDDGPVTRIPCVTTDPNEMAYASPKFLDICEGAGALIANSIHCPPECGGHWVCWACFDYGTEKGLIR